MPRRIAILLTTVDDSDFAKRFPNDGEKFRRLLSPLRPDWQFDVVAVKDNIFPDRPEDYDGYVITGSPASVNGPEPWIARLLVFIRAVHSARIPIFGACFGHQAIAAALGGKVDNSERGWRLGTALTHYEHFAPWMEPRQETVRLYAAHQEQVVSLPDGAELLGGDDHCPIGSYRIGDTVFATEYHPEMTPDFVAGLTDYLDGKLPDPVIARARNCLSEEAEGPFFARWIVNFLDQSAT